MPYARRVIPPDLAAMLASEADGVANDLGAARKSLACPPGSAVGRADQASTHRPSLQLSATKRYEIAAVTEMR